MEKENTTITNNNTKNTTENENKNQTTQKENNIEKTILTFKAPKKDLYGIYLNKDEVLTVKINQE